MIHYCWYGGKPLPELALRCIESWKKNCPDYEIIRWDEHNTDLETNDYIREAFENKKWAFITDYVRLWVLYKYGGIYMDTDVEVCKSLNLFLTESAFSGFESEKTVPTGIMAAEKGHPFIHELLNYYHDKHFLLPNGDYDLTTNVQVITNICLANGIMLNNQKQTICNMTFYPKEYFCPKNSKTGKMTITENTACIHHFNGSWLDPEERKYKTAYTSLTSKYGKFGVLLYEIYKYGLHPSYIFYRLKYGRNFLSLQNKNSD